MTFKNEESGKRWRKWLENYAADPDPARRDGGADLKDWFRGRVAAAAQSNLGEPRPGGLQDIGAVRMLT